MSYELRYISRHLNVQIWKVCPLTLRNYGFYPCKYLSLWRLARVQRYGFGDYPIFRWRFPHLKHGPVHVRKGRQRLRNFLSG